MADATGMVGADTSIYNNKLFQQQPSDPLTQMGKYVGLDNAMQQNKLLQGQVQLQQPQIDTAKLELMQKQVGAFRSSLGTLLASDNPTSKEIGELGSTGLQQGWFTPQQFSSEVSSWPGDKAPVEARKAWLQSHYVRQLGHEDQINMVLGRPTQFNLGRETVVRSVSPVNGVRDLSGGAMPNSMAPGTAADSVTGPPDASGAPTQITRGQFAEGQGLAVPGTYTAPNGAIVQRHAPPPPPLNTSRSPNTGPTAQTSVGAPVQTDAQGGVVPGQPPAAVAPPAPGMVSGLAPGVGESMKASAEALQQFRNDVGGPNGSASRIYALRSALTALDGTNTGLGTEGRQRIASYLNALPGGIGKWLPGVDPQSISDFDLSRKFLNAYALNAPGANRSDAGLAATQNANANVNISHEAAREIARSNIGLERMRQAQLADFDSRGVAPGQFSAESSKWNRTMDPKAFAADYQSPVDRAKYLNSLSAEGKKRYLDSVRMGIKTGVIDRSALAGGQ